MSNILDEYVEVKLESNSIKWYRSLGYVIEVNRRQCYANRNGVIVKNGSKIAVPIGATLKVKVEHLKPHSNQIIRFMCETCGLEFTTTWKAHRDKISNNCRSCQAKNGFKGGCQDYWFDLLIKNNPNAKCDISGVTDKRFLELHHLLSCKLGGINEEKNYAILSANYHTAFHRWAGGNKPTTPEQYYQFKEIELPTKIIK